MEIFDEQVNKSVNGLIDAIRNSDVYLEFMAAQQEVSRIEGLQEKIDAYRMENYRMQQEFQGEELLRKTEEFTRKYASFREDPVIDHFLSSELAFCRMVQDVWNELLKKLELD